MEQEQLGRLALVNDEQDNAMRSTEEQIVDSEVKWLWFYGGGGGWATN